MKVILQVSLNFFDSTEGQGYTTELREKYPGGEGSFWKEVELPSISFTVFLLDIRSPYGDGESWRVPFLPKDVTWVEKGGTTLIHLEQDPYFDQIYPDQFDQTTWKVGAFLPEDDLG